MASGSVVFHPTCVAGHAGEVTPRDVTRLALAAFGQRFRDFDRMVELAEKAERLSRSLPATRVGYDARASAASVLGNVYRILGDYTKSKRLLSRAVDLWREGSARPRLGCRIAELRASYFEAVRDLPAARLELELAERHRRAEGRELGKVWLQRGLVETHAGNADGAIGFYNRALQESRDRGIRTAAILSATWCWTEVENCGMADYLLARSRSYMARGPQGLQRRIPWLHARIADLRGSNEAAMALYSDSLRAFASLGFPQEAAAICLDMAVLEHRRQNWGRSLEKALQAGRLLAAVPGTVEAIASALLIHANRDRLATALEGAVANLFPLRTSFRRFRLS